MDADPAGSRDREPASKTWRARHGALICLALRDTSRDAHTKFMDLFAEIHPPGLAEPTVT